MKQGDLIDVRNAGEQWVQRIYRQTNSDGTYVTEGITPLTVQFWDEGREIQPETPEITPFFGCSWLDNGEHHNIIVQELGDKAIITQLAKTPCTMVLSSTSIEALTDLLIERRNKV
jgi:hypothetical protein